MRSREPTRCTQGESSLRSNPPQTCAKESIANGNRHEPIPIFKTHQTTLGRERSFIHSWTLDALVAGARAGVALGVVAGAIVAFGGGILRVVEIAG